MAKQFFLPPSPSASASASASLSVTAVLVSSAGATKSTLLFSCDTRPARTRGRRLPRRSRMPPLARRAHPHFPKAVCGALTAYGTRATPAARMTVTVHDRAERESYSSEPANPSLFDRCVGKARGLLPDAPRYPSRDRWKESHSAQSGWEGGWGGLL